MRKIYLFLGGRTMALSQALLVLLFTSITGLTYANSVKIGTTPYTTIQQAVNAASSGATIVVGPGVYPETIQVTKSLTILGPQALISPNNQGSRTNANGEATIVAQPIGLAFRAFVVNTPGVNVIIKGFRITGGEPLSDGNVTNSSGITLLFERNIVEQGSIFYGGAPFSSISINDNRFTDISNTAIFLTGVGTAIIQDNVINRVAKAGIVITASIIPGDPKTTSAIILRNKISNVQGEGIQLAHTLINAEVRFNEIDGANLSRSPGLGGIVLFDPSLFSGTKTIANNKVTNSVNGLAIVFGDNTGGGYDITGKDITVTNNSFDNTNSRFAIYHPGTGTLNAECNWLGVADPDLVAGRVYGPVDYDPYLIDATDVSSAIGFQPVPGSCKAPSSFVYCGNKNNPEKKVIVCHVPKGNPGNAHEICISINALQTHLDDGDSPGRCPENKLSSSAASFAITEDVFETLAQGSEEVKVSPNPAVGKMVKVQLKNFESVNADVYIVNQLGAIVNKRFVGLTNRSAVLTFNLANLSAGTYYVKVVSTSGIKTSKVLVK